MSYELVKLKYFMEKLHYILIKLVNSLEHKFNLIFSGSHRIKLFRPKFKVGNIVRINVRNRFENVDTDYLTKDYFIITKVRIADPITYYLKDINKNKIIGSFYENELQKI